MKISFNLKNACAVAGTLASLHGVVAGTQKHTDEWNIVFITSDEHNPKIMGCAGNKIIRTPALDKLAREGMYFSNAYSCTPVSAPTRQTIITGLYPQEHGQLSNSCKFDPRIPTWAAQLKKHGYITACIGKTHSYTLDTELGFDYRIEHPIPNRSNSKTLPLPEEDIKVYNAIPDIRLSGAPLPNDSVKFDGLVLKLAKKWIREQKDKKFFIHCSLLQPHWPWWSPENFYMMYDPKEIDFQKINQNDIADNYQAKFTFDKSNWGKITEEEHRLCRARYYGSISYVDNSVQQILDLLDELKLTKKTIVIYTSDHGDMAGEKGLWLKNLMYDAAARVPLIIRMPGVIKPGSKYDGLVSHVDYYPTIMGLAGIDQDLSKNLSGLNLAKSILSNINERKYAFCVDNISVKNIKNPGQEMVRGNRYKYIKYNNNMIPKGEEELLYDMINDKDEVKNLAHDPTMIKVLNEYRNALKEHKIMLKENPYPIVSMDVKTKKWTKD